MDPGISWQCFLRWLFGVERGVVFGDEVLVEESEQEDTCGGGADRAATQTLYRVDRTVGIKAAHVVVSKLVNRKEGNLYFLYIYTNSSETSTSWAASMLLPRTFFS